MLNPAETSNYVGKSSSSILKVQNTKKTLLQKIAKEITKKDINALLDKDFLINADPNPGVNAERIWYIDENNKHWTKSKPEGLPRPTKLNENLVFPSLDSNWLIGISQNEEESVPEKVIVLLGRKEDKILFLSNIIDESMLNNFAEIIEILNETIGKDLLIQFGNDNKNRLLIKELLKGESAEQMVKKYKEKRSLVIEKKKQEIINKIQQLSPKFEHQKIFEYKKNTVLGQEDAELRSQYEKDKNDFDNGILELTKNGKAPSNNKLRTNNEAFSLENFNRNQKRVLQLKQKNNEKSKKTFQEFQIDAKDNYNKIRLLYFLTPITNHLSEISKEDFGRYIIQTNEIADTKNVLKYLNELSEVEAENQEVNISELYILIDGKPEPQTIVNVRLPNSFSK